MTTYAETTIKIATLEVRDSAGEMLVTPEKVYEEMRHIGGLAQETMNVITLDAKNRVIGKTIVSIGTLSSCTVHPRDVFRIAIADNAAAVILAHNHPSGDPTPSSDDITITKQLVSAGIVMGIRVLDHIVIGRESGRRSDAFLSLRETALVNFSG